MSYVSETIWVAEGSISSRDIVVVVADITDGSVAYQRGNRDIVTAGALFD